MVKRDCGICVNCRRRAEMDEDENIVGLECLDPIVLMKKAAQKEPEKINHPSHYGGDTVYEAIKVIEAWGLGFHLGNAVKYLCRFGKKDDRREPIEDLRKARWYIDRKIQEMEKADVHQDH
jgi:hypothetical protein